MDARDEALLHDLLDDRLPAAEAAALRERLDADRELREVWDELVQVREALRAETHVRAPGDFLTGVRRRIAAEASQGGDPAPADAGPRPSLLDALRLARARRTRWALAAAATVVVALGAGLLLRRGDDAPRTWEKAEGGVADRLEVRDAREPSPATRESAARARGAPDAASGPLPPPPAEAARPRFRPADAVPPGLRPPSDAPAAPPAAPAPGEPTPPAPAEPSARGSVAARAEPAAAALPVYWLQADDHAEGVAKLAVLVERLRKEVRAPLREGRRVGAARFLEGEDDGDVSGPRPGGAPAVPGGGASAEDAAAAGEVLGTVWITVEPEVAEALLRHGAGRGHRTLSALTAAPGAGGAEGAVPPEAETLHRAKEAVDEEEPDEEAPASHDKAARRRVKVVFVRGR